MEAALEERPLIEGSATEVDSGSNPPAETGVFLTRAWQCFLGHVPVNASGAPYLPPSNTSVLLPSQCNATEYSWDYNPGDEVRAREKGSAMRLWGFQDVPVQKEASAFLYISQMSPYLMGNIVKRSSLVSSRGSGRRFSAAFSATIFAITSVFA